MFSRCHRFPRPRSFPLGSWIVNPTSSSSSSSGGGGVGSGGGGAGCCTSKIHSKYVEPDLLKEVLALNLLSSQDIQQKNNALKSNYSYTCLEQLNALTKTPQEKMKKIHGSSERSNSCHTQ